MVIVDIISPKEVELRFFSLGVSNYCESSLSLTSVLTCWILILSDTVHAKTCAPTEAAQALIIRFCIEV